MLADFMTDDNNKPDENKLIAERRAKLAALREQGNAFPNDFRRNAIAEELHQTFHAHDKDALEKEQIEVSVSGRMMAKRVMGKASFIKLQDRSGQIQVRLERDRLPEGVYQAFKKWDVGDIVGARGPLFRTQTGELTVLADDGRLLELGGSAYLARSYGDGFQAWTSIVAGTFQWDGREARGTWLEGDIDPDFDDGGAHKDGNLSADELLCDL